MVKQTVLSENYGHRFLSKAISVGFKKHLFQPANQLAMIHAGDWQQI